MRKKQIKNNQMVIKGGQVTYTTKDGFNVTSEVSDYDGAGNHLILEAVFNLADNNIEGHELVQRFDAWLRGQPEPTQIHHPYSLANI